MDGGTIAGIAIGGTGLAITTIGGGIHYWRRRGQVKINTIYLTYDKINNDPDDSIVVIGPYLSFYNARLVFLHRGKPTTINNLILVINGRERISSVNFEPLRLEHGDSRELSTIFPVEESSAVEEGTFEIAAVDTFNKVHKCKGKFPIGQ